MHKRKRRKKQKGNRNVRTVEKYGKPFRGAHVSLSCEASGIYRRPSTADVAPSFDLRTAKGEGLPNTHSSSSDVQMHEYNREMIEREKAARKEADRRRKMVAPMYNKGAYQYVGGIEDEQVIKDLGRKK